MSSTIAVIGASQDRSKFGNKCVRAYADAGWTVYPVHPKAQEIEGLQCFHNVAHCPQPLDRISVYLPPAVGKGLLEGLCDVQHQELWLNPGTHDPELLDTAKRLGLNPIAACSIVDIGKRPGDYR